MRFPRPRQAGVVTACAVTALVVPGCTIERPEMPSYETEWRIPLGSIDKTIGELLEDQEDIVVGEDGSLSLTHGGELAEVEIDAELEADVEGLSVAAEIGPIELDPTDPVGFDHRLGDLYPTSEAFDGQQAPVPPFSFDVDSPEQDLPGFRSATVASGGLVVEVTNGLPVPVGASSGPDQIQIELIDPDGGATVAALPLPEAIAPGGSARHTLDFAGRTLPDAVRVHLGGGSPGSGGTLVTIDADAQLQVLVSTTALVVSEAEAEIGAQEFEQTSTVDLPPDVRIRYAELDAGSLDLSLRNDLSVDVDVQLRIDPFFDALGQPLRVDVAVPAGSTAQPSVDLSTHRIDFGAGVGDHLDVVATVSTPGSAGQTVIVRATDEVVVDVAPLTLSFSRVTGIVDPVEVELASTTTELDLPQELEDLQLRDATLDISIVSSVGMPSHIDLQLVGTNDAGQSVPLDVQIAMPPQLIDAPPFHVQLDPQNSNVLSFLNNLPTSISIEGSAVVGDGVTVGTVQRGDTVSARWSISAPLSVALMKQNVQIDASSLELDEDLRDELRSRLIELTLDAEVTSTLPVRAVATIGLDPDVAQVYDNPQLRLGPIEIPAAGPARGDGTRAEVTSSSRVVLEDGGIDIVTQDQLFHGLQIYLPGTGGDYVTLHASDRVRVSGFLRARVLVGEVD